MSVPDDHREGSLRALLTLAVAQRYRVMSDRGETLKMTKIVRAFPMTWWSTWISIIFSTVTGLLYLIAPANRFSASAFDTIKSSIAFLPGESMKAWGVIYLLLGVVTAIAIIRSITVTRLALWCGCGLYMFYAFLFLLAARDSTLAPIGPVLLYMYISTHHLAAAQTITMIADLGESVVIPEVNE